MFISLTSGIRAYGCMGQMWQGYRGSFRSWNGNEICVLETLLQMEQAGSLLQLEWGRYIALSKPIKLTQNDLGKGPTKEYYCQ